MAQNYTFDEIKARVIGRGSKASKIEWLTKEAGYTERDAESTYNLILMLNPRPAPTRRQRREVREATEAVFQLMHFTVGVELECTNVNRNEVRRICAERGIATRDDFHDYNHRDSRDTYKLMSDGSLRRSRSDAYPTCEIVTPVLNDLASLKTVCEILNEAGASVNKSCGLHVHFGAARFTDAQWRRIICNYGRIERIIDAFMPASRRGDASQWCASIVEHARRIEARPGMTREAMRSEFGGRYHKVNLEAFARHSTIEFRQHSGTIDFAKIENWVKFLAGLLTYSIQNEALLEARTIDDLPFLNREQKAFFKRRTNGHAERENRPAVYTEAEAVYNRPSRCGGYSQREADLAGAFAGLR